MNLARRPADRLCLHTMTWLFVSSDQLAGVLLGSGDGLGDLITSVRRNGLVLSFLSSLVFLSVSHFGANITRSPLGQLLS
jgi:hypothetical protein